VRRGFRSFGLSVGGVLAIFSSSVSIRNFPERRPSRRGSFHRLVCCGPTSPFRYGLSRFSFERVIRFLMNSVFIFWVFRLKEDPRGRNSCQSEALTVLGILHRIWIYHRKVVFDVGDLELCFMVPRSGIGRGSRLIG
jgi:hypothetical protein